MFSLCFGILQWQKMHFSAMQGLYAFVGMILLVLVKLSPYTITESCWFSLSIRLELIPALSHLAVAVVYAN